MSDSRDLFRFTEARSRWRPRLLVVAGAALVLVAAGLIFWPEAVLRGYLAALLFWLALPLGAAGLLLLHALVGGRWGEPVRVPFIAMMQTMPLLVVLAVPIIVGMRWLYPWVAGEHAAEEVGTRGAYLNVSFFVVRAVLYLAFWLAACLWLRRRRGGATGSIGLIAYVLTVTFAAIDWIGTLDPHWYSSILGLYLVIGQVLAAMAAAVLIGFVGAEREFLPPLGEAAPEGGPSGADLLHDLGTLTLTFVALHAYIAFSQYFIIWNGNLPHEIRWYVPRMRGIWGAAALSLMFAHFALPFVLLLVRRNKRDRQRMMLIAGLLLAMRAVEYLWMVIPAREDGRVLATLAALGAWAGMGAAWVLLLASRLERSRKDEAPIAMRVATA
jgi:hypothetical protein